MVNTDTLLNDIRDQIKSRLESKWTEFAVGTDGTAESSSDTSLGNQVFTDSIDSVETSTNTKLFKCHLLTSEANGNTLKEFGLKDSSGNLGYRKTYSGIGKTTEIDVWFELEQSISVT